MDISASL